MKYILTPILLFIFWKLYYDWQALTARRTANRRRETALQAFEMTVMRLEMQASNGNITTEELQRARAEALERLRIELAKSDK